MIIPRPGTMDQNIIEEMRKDPYFVRHHVKNGDVVMDCGANIGAFAEYVLSVAPKAKIICIEPMPSNIAALRENLKGRSYCSIVDSALMGEDGAIEMYDFGPEASACHSIYHLGSNEAVKIEVNALTLSQIMHQEGIDHIDFLKLDVQGAEYEIIPNHPSGILDKANYIAMELHASIAKDGAVIGDIPDTDRKIAEIVRHLSGTHVLLRGIPMGNSISLWKSKRNATSAELLRGWINAGFLPMFLIYQQFRSMVKKTLYCITAKQ